MLAAPGVVAIVESGERFTTDGACGPITNAVAFAIRRAKPGDVIGVYGMHPGLRFVPQQSSCRQSEVSWAEGAVIRGISIVGMGPKAGIEGIFIKGDYTRRGQGGIDKLTFQSLTIRNPRGSRTPLQSDNLGRHGLLRVYNCKFTAEDPSSWGGKGMKFGMRLHLLTADLRANRFTTGAQEHNFYVDSPGWDSAYPFALVVVGNSTDAPSGRTGIQIVNRINPINGNPYLGAPGRGTILIRNNSFHADASGGGGSTVTIAGHYGDVWVQENVIRASGGSGGSKDTGGLVVWSPDGTWLMDNGFATKAIYINRNRFVGTGSRPSISASGAETIKIGKNLFAADGNAVEFDNRFGLGKPNGFEQLPPSNMPGWLQSGCKAKDMIGSGFQCLTDLELDELY
jgi:hypothetical protein